MGRADLGLGVLRSISALLLCCLVGCSTYRSELHRGQRYYEENDYEAALALWRVLEPNQSGLTADERVRYFYFRGMTDYRLGYRADARYWLSLARAGERLTPASLPAEYKLRLEETLEDLSGDLVADQPAEGAPSEDANKQPQVPGASPGDPAGSPCKWSSECPRGYICQDQVCVEL